MTTTPAADGASTPKPADAQTVYVVLRLTDDQPPSWREDGPHQTARSANEAIRQAAELRHESDLSADGTYIAVPLRSWKPLPIRSAMAFKIGGAA